MKFPPSLISFVLFASSTLAPSAAAQSDQELGIQPRSDEGQQAIARFSVPEGFVPKLWASEPDLANPVAFYIDYHGRAYVAETFRQETEGVPDNRSHRYWLEDDLRLQTVEERAEMYLKHHPEYATEWTDRNDRIRRLVDTDGDGMADQSTLFADGFGELLDGTGAGVYVRGNEVWYTCIPKLWKLTDEDDDGVADQREALHHGYGVRVAFRGHDMHGMVLGPDGRLYWSIGDRGYNVVSQEGVRYAQPHTGAVFRCELDGSNLEVFATGLRNPQELAFDDYGNLFTGDNNCDAGDQARLVYVMEGGDCGWSMNFQYLPDRGPWMSESWWKPRFEGQPAFLNPPIANLAAGPSGFTHYPGVGLPDEYRDSFFLVDFRGGANGSGIWRFNVDADGAGFTLGKHEQFWWKILATDADFGPDGRLWASDWVSGWSGVGKGRLYQLDPPAGVDRQLMAQTAALLSGDFESREQSELIGLLHHQDRRVRQEAQLALMSQGEAAVAPLAELARDQSARDLPRIHAIWALARLGAGGVIAELLVDNDARVRAEAARSVGDCAFPAAPALVAALQDQDARVRYFAAQSLGKVGRAEDCDALVAAIEANADRDRFLRHALGLALARIGHIDSILQAAEHQSASVRLASVLALRHLRHPSVAILLDDQDTYVATEAAIAIYDAPIDAALPALASTLTSRSDWSFAFARRALHAANRLGGAKRHAAVLHYLLAEGSDDKLREEAANLLADWAAPREFDVLRNQSRVYGDRDMPTAREQFSQRVDELLAIEQPKARRAVIRAVRNLQLKDAEAALAKLVSAEAGQDQTKIDALQALLALDSARLADALRTASRSNSAKLRAHSIRMLAQWDAERALPVLIELLPQAQPAELAAAFGALADLKSAQADAYLVVWINKLGLGEVPGAAQLELHEAATRRASQGSVGLQAALQAWRNSFNASDDLAAYRIALEGGDVATGRKLFYEDATASCQRCHYVAGDSSEEMPAEVGPALHGIGLARTREQLLRSMVAPASEIAPGFEFYDGSGELLPVSAMLPNLAEALGPRKLRDLVAYLDSKRETTRIMVFVYSAGYEHQVAKADEDGMSLVEKQWQSWADQDSRFDVVINRDPSWFTADNLNSVDAVFFYTTGELPLSEEGRMALQSYVEQGGGFSGAHCATDTYYQWPWFGDMIGGYFDGHPWHANSTVGVLVEDQQHRACEHLPERFQITDEIYQFKDPYSRQRQHILMSLDTENSPMDVGNIKRNDGDFAIAWTRTQGKGRVFYSSLGHRADVWTNPEYQRHLVEGVLWAAGR